MTGCARRLARSRTSSSPPASRPSAFPTGSTLGFVMPTSKTSKPMPTTSAANSRNPSDGGNAGSPTRVLDNSHRDQRLLCGGELRQIRIPHEVIEPARREYLPMRGREQIAKVLSSYAEPPTVDARHDLKPRLTISDALIAHVGKPQDTSHLVTRSPVIAGDLCLDDHRRGHFVGNEEVRGLLEAMDALGSPGLPERDARMGQLSLDRALHDITDEFGHRSTVGREGASHIPLVE